MAKPKPTPEVGKVISTLDQLTEGELWAMLEREAAEPQPRVYFIRRIYGRAAELRRLRETKQYQIPSRGKEKK